MGTLREIMGKTSLKVDPYDLALSNVKKHKISKVKEKGVDEKKEFSEAEVVKDEFEGLTDAEKKHLISQKARLEKSKSEKKLTYKEKMQKLNQHLASLTQHFDQPRISG
eukprot:GDKJ01005278.1.p1 GENE.GDKJ01005278.1~~GDKJ01005278.1.p1  ORF type:complete len:109 (-),score=30.80 GDKJ01005278.1:181-507(-)